MEDIYAHILKTTGMPTLSRVLKLSLKGLGLTSLDSDFSSKLQNLRRLDLSDNFLTELSLDLPHLEYLNVENNDIQSFDNISFDSLPALTNLSFLGNYGLRNVLRNEVLKKLPNLTTLNGWLVNDDETLRYILCVVCGGEHPEERMVVCDGCDYVFHFECTEPELEEAPEGDFFCNACRKAQKAKGSTLKKGKVPALQLARSMRLDCVMRMHSILPINFETYVWACAFRPKVKGDPTPIIATCGGSIVCVTDVESKHVLQKYNHAGEMYVCVAWSAVPVGGGDGEESGGEDEGEVVHVLAAAGELGDVYVMLPSRGVCYDQLKEHSTRVHCVAFHPIRKRWLFSGSADGTILLWDIHVPGAESSPSSRLLYRFITNHGINHISFPGNDPMTFLVGGDKGYVAKWRVEQSGKIEPEKPKKHSRKRAKVEKEIEDTHTEPITIEEPVCVYGNVYGLHDDRHVDCIIPIGKNIVASKSAHDQRIALWDHMIGQQRTKREKGKHFIGSLIHSESNYYYSRMSLSPDGKTLLAGDMQGNLRLFDLTVNFERTVPMPPVRTLSFDHPELKHPLRDVAVSPDSRYVVAVSDSNLVLVFKCVQE